MRVLIAPALHSYTGGTSEVEAQGSTLAEVLEVLERKYPGIRFRIVDEQQRIRPHIKFFVAGTLASSISQRVGSEDEVQIICALSGG